MVNIRNLIDDVKCFQTVRDLRGPGGDLSTLHVRADHQAGP